jgi:hypothetical protein
MAYAAAEAQTRMRRSSRVLRGMALGLVFLSVHAAPIWAGAPNSSPEVPPDTHGRRLAAVQPSPQQSLCATDKNPSIDLSKVPHIEAVRAPCKLPID